MKREKTAAKIKEAVNSWSKAPAHVRIMAAAYVVPLLEALDAINEEMDELKKELIKGVL